ncbi:MAG: hypothetical protein WC770_00180 [Phycisphaerae bacterium]|jgi:hypothetical protein
MAKKLIVLAVITLLAVCNGAFAFDRYGDNWYQWNGGYSQHRWHHTPQRRMPLAFLPPRQVVVEPIVTVEDKTITVWITNNNGSQTEVKLIPAVNGGYTGPKGEYYSSMPTEGQLKAVYGLPCAAPVRNNVIFYLGKSNGSEIVVILTKDGSEFLGPKGERYSVMPTEEQLKLIYGN